MSDHLDVHDRENLTYTLASALAQSQTLVQTLDDQNRRIDSLTRENERLRGEIVSLRSKNIEHHDGSPCATQMEQMFRKDAERQAEIDRLKKELQKARSEGRKWRSLNPQLLSPVVSSDEVDVATPSHILKPIVESNAQMSISKRSFSPPLPFVRQTQQSPPRKHPRVQFVEPNRFLKEINNNRGSRPSENLRRKRRRSTTSYVDAIRIFAEDGQAHDRKKNDIPQEHKETGNNCNEPYKRLDALLSTPSSNNPPLKIREKTMIPSNALPPQPKVQLRHHGSGSKAVSSTKPAERGRPLFLPPNPRSVKHLEDEAPLRSRPISCLNLSHFKLNLKFSNGNDFAFDKTVRNRRMQKCLPGCSRPECCGSKFKAIAATLDLGVEVSEDDLLLGFLGPGSEDKIRSLTAVARENLLHEARARKIANEYGKMHRNADERAQSPVDFWNAEMPSTQEEKENREKARLREREEVERRYQEASRADGRWMFADE